VTLLFRDGESEPRASAARYPRSMPHATHEKGALPAWLSDDERKFRASLEGLVDFYRVAQGDVLWRAFWPGAFISLPLGSLLMALAMRGRLLRALTQGSVQFRLDGFEPALTLLAIAVIASAPIWAIYTLLSSMRRDDRYVAIFQEELRVCLEPGGEPLHIPWQELSEVALRPESTSCLVLVWAQREIEIKVSFAELTLTELAQRIRDARRLALWGRLTRPALLGD
jgi:hypothetical protein